MGTAERQNPELPNAKPQKQEPRGESREYSLNQPDLLRLEAAAKSPRERASIRLLARFGLRAGELAHFNLSWFSGQRGVLTVPLMCRCDTCQAAGKPWRPKRKASHRSLPIYKHTETWEAVKIFFERHPTIEDVQVSERAVHKLVVKVADRAGLQAKVFPHALRATAATQFAAMGANELQLCSLMGWHDLRSAAPYLQGSPAIAAAFLEDAELKWW